MRSQRARALNVGAERVAGRALLLGRGGRVALRGRAAAGLADRLALALLFLELLLQLELGRLVLGAGELGEQAVDLRLLLLEGGLLLLGLLLGVLLRRLDGHELGLLLFRALVHEVAREAAAE